MAMLAPAVHVRADDKHENIPVEQYKMQCASLAISNVSFDDDGVVVPVYMAPEQ